MSDGDSWKEKISFELKKGSNREKVIDFVNRALESNSEFLEKECLLGGLKDYISDMYVKIIEEKNCYIIDLNPHSGEGHDFCFEIKKKTGKIDKNSMMVGSLISEPDDEENA
ncbi:MAG: hypothetical protein ACFFCS_10105 [Candidatus Hodarchaeota archaeon]